jgi:hypothetical protein
MEMNPAELAANSAHIKDQISGGLDVAHGVIDDLGIATTLGQSQVRDPTGKAPTLSSLENDVLETLGFGMRNNPGGKPQLEHFDVGNFGHTHAEELVDGLPMGLSKEVTITLGDGTVRRTDRVSFIYDDEGNIVGGKVYEIKPNTTEGKRVGEIQAELYARYLEEVHHLPRGKFKHQCLSYDAERVRALVRKLRLPIK